MSIAQEIVQEVWGEVMAMERRRVLEEIAEGQAEKHKLTRIMTEKGANYRYYDAGVDEKGRKINFGYCVHRNAAGYFLTWREVWDAKKGEGFRDQWAANKMKRTVISLARGRRDEWRKKHAH